MSSPALPSLPPGRRVLITTLAENPAEAIERAELVPMEAPDPATLGPRDVLIQIKSCAVGWVDLIMASGQYQHLVPPPYTPGLEYAGVVAWVGPEVTTIAVGAEVLVDGFLAGPRSHGAYQRWGGYASYAVAPMEAVHHIPGKLNFDQACNLLGSYETAYHCLIHRGRLQPGETVLVHGASGSTGLAAVHLAKLIGATVIATGRTAAKLARVKAAGADHVVPLFDELGAPRSLKDEVRALTGGKGVEVVYDSVGGDLSVESLRCVRFGARYLIVGWAATPLVARGAGGRGAPNANFLPTNLIMMKGLDVLGCPTVISTVQDPTIRVPRLAQLWKWVEAGQLVPVVDQGYELEDFRDAMRAKWQGEVFAAAVLHP
jgi:NADPH2:quinone reductase